MGDLEAIDRVYGMGRILVLLDFRIPLSLYLFLFDLYKLKINSHTRQTICSYSYVHSRMVFAEVIVVVIHFMNSNG